MEQTCHTAVEKTSQHGLLENSHVSMSCWRIWAAVQQTWGSTVCCRTYTTVCDTSGCRQTPHALSLLFPARNLPIDFLSHRLGDYRRLGKFHSPAWKKEYPCREWTAPALDGTHGHMTIISKPSFVPILHTAMHTSKSPGALVLCM
jgi:hypothetical protein